MRLGHHFQGQKVKGQGHQAALLIAALTRKAAAAVSVGTCVRNYCYVAVCSAALGASAPTEGGEGRGHIVAAARLQLVKTKTKMISNTGISLLFIPAKEAIFLSALVSLFVS